MHVIWSGFNPHIPLSRVLPVSYPSLTASITSSGGHLKPVSMYHLPPAPLVELVTLGPGSSMIYIPSI